MRNLTARLIAIGLVAAVEYMIVWVVISFFLSHLGWGVAATSALVVAFVSIWNHLFATMLGERGDEA